MIYNLLNTIEWSHEVDGEGAQFKCVNPKINIQYK